VRNCSSCISIRRLIACRERCGASAAWAKPPSREIETKASISSMVEAENL
jgi:hypothetical protein